MIIGILAESSSDSEPLKSILIPITNTPTTFITYEAHGGIVSSMEKAAKLFFNAEPKCNIAVFLNDMDAHPERCKKIKTWVRKYNIDNPSSVIVVGCPEITFEQWLLSEEHAVKKVLGLNPNQPLPYSNLHPKSRLQRIIDENNTDITMTNKEIYIEIAKNMNLELLAGRDRNFKQFYKDFYEASMSIT